jgi:hypothetical protein
VPRLSVWCVRAALAYLGLGFTFGALILFHKGVPLHPQLWRLLPAHFEFLVVGWTMNLALGVAYWILPRFVHGAPRGNPLIAWAAAGLLNAGVLAASAAVVPGLASAPIVGRVLQLLAAVLFAVHLWPRVRAFGV